LNYYTPNINPNNNIISFQSSNTGSTIYSVVLPEGFYLNSTSLMLMIITALNTVTGSSGLSFNYALGGISSNTATLTSSGGSFKFTPSSFMTYGQYVVNLPFNDILSTSKLLGPILLLYTRWIDISSDSLLQYTKNANTSNSLRNANLLFRLFVKSPNPEIISANPESSTAWHNYNKSAGIQIVDLHLRDEYGLPLYIPSYATNFNFIIELIGEL